jgi:DNA-binding response OmpR family regulator
VSKVLVIDDDIDLADLTRRRLQRMGLTAKVHGGAHGAMDLLLRDAFDLIILDLNMPGLGGAEVMKMIRMARPERIKVMFFSSADPTELRRLTELHGADGYLSKSATAQEFEFRIRDLLRSGVRSGGPAT